MTKCIIIEDQAPAQRILQKYINDFGSLDLVATLSNAISALEYLQENTVDLIFLDVHMPQMSGIDFLRQLSQSPVIILTTAFPDFALESYNLGVVDYLLKPFSFQRFLQAINKANNILLIKQDNTDLSVANYIFIKSGYEHIKINIKEINFIKSDRDYTELYIGEKMHLSTNSLKYWVEHLHDFCFLRVHKSYVINEHKISKIVGSNLFLDTGVEIPIGRAFKESLMKTIKNISSS